MIFLRRCFIILSTFLLIVACCNLFGCSGSEAAFGGSESELSFSTLDVIPSVDTNPLYSDEVVIPTEFKILREGSAVDSFFSSAEETDIMSKNVYERNALLEQQYGISIVEESRDDILDQALVDAFSQDAEYDMLLISAPSASSLVVKGALADLEALAAFDKNGAGYNGKIMSELSMGGRMFLAAGDATPSLVRSASAIAVNRELLSRIEGKEDIFELAAAGDLTHEIMLEYSAVLAELDLSDKILSPSSFIKAEADDAMALFISGGGRFFVRNSVTDEFCAADFGGENKNVFSSVMSLFGIVASEDNEEDNISFAESSPLFTVSNIGNFEAIAGGDSPYALLPMPKMVPGREGYTSFVDVKKVSFAALPSGGDNENAVSVMNLIFGHSEGISLALKEKCASDTMYDIIKDSVSCDLLTFFDYGDLRGMMRDFVKERSSEKVFELRALDRSTAAIAAVSIITNNFYK
ncbi:MAG: hypothetical protein IJ303_03890 [Clostridia bacterium]|nr:hypothetical protein [Clostridia bacterium]